MTSTLDRAAIRHAQIRLAQLVAHPANIREDLTDIEDLAASIRQVGLLQPLTVTPHDTEPDRYLILAGHRRARACMLAGLVAVPCVVRPVADRGEQITLMLIENCQRVDLNPIEQAQALSALRARGATQADLAKMTGKSDAWVSYRLGLLDLPSEAQAAIIAGTLSVANAEAAVRAARRADRDGRQLDRGWEPDFFVLAHPLARKARSLCDDRQHNLRRRIGRIACGQCWESVIRDDERRVVAVLGANDGCAH